MKAFQFPQQTAFYSGKVRDVYTIADKWLVMIASNRISAFDVILPKAIPYKGQVLNQIAAYMLKATTDICPNWLLNTPGGVVDLRTGETRPHEPEYFMTKMAAAAPSGN